MQALRTRLLIALAAVLLATWGSGFAMLYMDMSSRQGGEIDGMLRNIAEQIVQSLPEDIAAPGQKQRFTLAGSSVSRAHGKLDSLGFQAWDRQARRSLLSSKTSPVHAMNQEFTDGFADTTVAGAPWRVYSISDVNQRVQVQVGLPQAAIKAEVLRWLGKMLAAALVLLICIGIAIWLVIHWSLRPVTKVAESVALRAPLDLTPLPEQGLPAEFTPLVRSFNQLMARLAQALKSEREFLGEAAHELRTPLAALLTQAQVLQHATSPDEARVALSHLVAGIVGTSRLAQQLLDAARVESGSSAARAADVDLAIVVSMVADEFELVAQRGSQTIELEANPAPMHGDFDDLGIMVRNLLDNALRHGRAGTRVRLETGGEGDGSTRMATLVVADDGPGIPEEERARVFERFYRAGNANRARGIGLGLSLVQRVVTSHGGTLRCGVGLDGLGFGVEIRLPAARITNSGSS
jgi:two-component system sensor histidine kinase QseC